MQKSGETWYEWFGSGDTEKIKERAKQIGLISDNEILLFTTIFSEQNKEYQYNLSDFHFYFCSQNFYISEYENPSKPINHNSVYIINFEKGIYWE